MNKKKLKGLGLISLSLGMLFVGFKPLESSNKNSLFAGLFNGLALGLMISSYTKTE